MTRKVVVLYEDRVQGVVKDYGPHVLVKQCICDRLNIAPWELKAVEAVPRSGNGNVYRDCASEPPKLGRDGSFVVAVYDFDHVRELKQLGLPATACKSDTRDALLKTCPWRERLVVVFLDRNIETVIEAICECAPTIATQEQRTQGAREEGSERARHHPPAASAPSAAGLALRNCLFERAFRYLVDKLVGILS